MSEEHKDNHGGGGEAHAESHGKGHGGGGHGGGHGGGSHEEHEGAPEWLISFADNVALLMGFFVILLAMNMSKPTAGGIGGEGKYPSNDPSERMTDFAIEMRAAFNNPVDPESTDPREASLVKRQRERLQKGETSDPGPDGDKKNVQALRPSDYVNIAGYVTYADQASELSPDADHTLESVAEKVRGHSFMIEVRGHVSAQEARQDKAAAMRLAYERAYAAADGLVRHGVRWDVLRVVACADNERATPRATGDGHKNNQRAEVVITQEQKPPDPFASVETGN